MQRIRLVLLALTVAVVGLAPASASARGNVLPTPTYNAIVAVNDAAVPLDSDAAPTPAQLAKLRSACKAMPKRGALLAALRRDCDASLAVFVAAVGSCKTERECLKSLGRMGDAADRAVRQMVSTGRVINREVPAGRCRVALRASPAEIKLGREMVAVLRAMERATRKRDAKAIDAATKRMERIDDSKARSAVQIRDAIRDRC